MTAALVYHRRTVSVGVARSAASRHRASQPQPVIGDRLSVDGNRISAVDTERVSRAGIGLAVSIVLSALYCLVLLMPRFARTLGPLSAVRPWFHRLAKNVLVAFGAEEARLELRLGFFFILILLIIPWLAMLCAGRGRPWDIGLRSPNRIGWRILAIGFLLALPFQIWMVNSPGFARYYVPQIERAGLTVFLLYYTAVLLGEHFFFHGVLLATCRSGGRWPSPPPLSNDAGTAVGRILQWIGLCQPVDSATGVRRLTRWIGLRDGCLLAVFASAALFTAIHIGKDPRELLLSFPGGVGLAYVAYRTNTWLIPYLLHAATAAIACALMLWMN